ncbi:MAG: hypothetical protein PHG43_04550 [Phenylobacterium sp.]|nr:hypothetical protein [Phenylobacterium sp.]
MLAIRVRRARPIKLLQRLGRSSRGRAATSSGVSRVIDEMMQGLTMPPEKRTLRFRSMGLQITPEPLALSVISVSSREAPARHEPLISSFQVSWPRTSM